MSKVYEAHLAMQELCQDIGWQEWQEEQERLAQEENYGLNDENMPEAKAQKFAKAIIDLN